MKLLFLGSGSAFTVGDNNYQSNMLITSETGKHLLLDCGNDARLSLNEQGYAATDIDAVYITHLHADHVGGLEWLAYKTKFALTPYRPRLYISEQMVQPLWENVLRGGLSAIRGVDATLETFFEVIVISSENTFTWENIHFSQMQTFHAVNNNQYMPSFGLMIHHPQETILITMDTEFRPDFFAPYYEQASLIFHDCETMQRHSTVHPHYQDLITLDPVIKAKSWLYDYNPGPRPDPRADGFIGFIVKGQQFEFKGDSDGPRS
jgi:ribonuclease BN (tRNA processing enzyme)